MTIQGSELKEDPEKRKYRLSSHFYYQEQDGSYVKEPSYITREEFQVQ